MKKPSKSNNRAQVQKVISALKNKTQLAAKLGLSRQAVQKWTQIPTKHVLVLEEMTGIPRHEMRPDIYPAP